MVVTTLNLHLAPTCAHTFTIFAAGHFLSRHWVRDRVCNAIADNKRIESKIGLQRMWLSYYYCWTSLSFRTVFRSLLLIRCGHVVMVMMIACNLKLQAAKPHQRPACWLSRVSITIRLGRVHSFTKCFRGSIAGDAENHKKPKQKMRVFASIMHFFPSSLCEAVSILV